MYVPSVSAPSTGDIVDESEIGQFYLDNKGLVGKPVRKVLKRCLQAGHAVDYDELEGISMEVFVMCCRSFDASKGFQFSTYFIRSAFRAMNKYLEKYDADKEVLGVISLSSGRGSDGEELDMESTIPSDSFLGPEEALAAKQALERITKNLSPLAGLMLGMMVDPSDDLCSEIDMLQNFARVNGKPVRELTLKMVGDFVQKVAGVSDSDIQSAKREINGIDNGMLETPVCFGSVLIRDSSSERCQNCVVNHACLEKTAQTASAFTKHGNLSEMMKRHKELREHVLKARQAVIEAADPGRIMTQHAGYMRNTPANQKLAKECLEKLHLGLNPFSSRKMHLKLAASLLINQGHLERSMLESLLERGMDIEEELAIEKADYALMYLWSMGITQEAEDEDDYTLSKGETIA